MKSILVVLIVSMIIAIIISLITLALKKEIKEAMPLMITIVAVATFLSIIYSTTTCTEYQEWKIASETQIAKLSDEGGKDIYVQCEGGEYIYRYETKEVPLWSETAKEYITFMEEAVIIEDVNCDRPELIIYEREPVKGKFTSWTLATFCGPEVKYVLYVPEGSIKY